MSKHWRFKTVSNTSSPIGVPDNRFLYLTLTFPVLIKAGQRKLAGFLWTPVYRMIEFYRKTKTLHFWNSRRNGGPVEDSEEIQLSFLFIRNWYYLLNKNLSLRAKFITGNVISTIPNKKASFHRLIAIHMSLYECSRVVSSVEGRLEFLNFKTDST